MLTHIHIRDFAIVDELELTFEAGMSVLTGETGAGKSIVVDALGLALGDRADISCIRQGRERAEVAVSFDVNKLEDARIWLEERDLAADGECLVRRSFGRDGRSRGYINAVPVPMQSLRELGGMLVDIHGQHEHQSLLKAELQRRLLDQAAGHGEILHQLGQCYQRWQDATRELRELSGDVQDRDARLELLNYQYDEIRALGVDAAAIEELDHEHARLANASRLLETGQRVQDTLSESEHGAILEQLNHCVVELRELQDIEPRYAALAELLENAAIQVQEAASDLRHILDSQDLDPTRLPELEQRLGTIHDIARKHRVQPVELPAVMERLRQELKGLQDAEGRLQEIEQSIGDTVEEYREIAQTISRSRAAAASSLAERVTNNMHELGMPGGRFEVRLQPVESQDLTPWGRERVDFLVSTNPGQEPGPLSRIASGGELSRISLAIQVVNAVDAEIPTMIFDEVDVGIGGGVAEIVGRLLRDLAAGGQVISVTHLPQVAAQSHHHYRVSKQARDDHTRVGVTRLDAEQCNEEVARMLGGVKITDQTLAHASEMIAQARSRS